MRKTADDVIFNLLRGVQAGCKPPRSQVRTSASSSTMDHVQEFFNPLDGLGDMIIGGANGQMRKRDIGAEGQVLKVVSGVPQWSDP